MDVFSFCVTGPAEQISNAARTRATEITQMFRKAGMFKTESNTIVYAAPYCLEDLARFSPQDIHEIGGALAQGIPAETMFPDTSAFLSGSRDVARIFVGAYFREYDAQEDSDLFSENFDARADAEARIAAYEAEAAAVFGDLCDVTAPLSFAFGLSIAVDATLNALAASVDDDFFVDPPVDVAFDDEMTWEFSNAEGVRLAFDLPRTLGVITHGAVIEWSLAHPAYGEGICEDDYTPEEDLPFMWGPEAEDVADAGPVPFNVLAFPDKKN